MSRHEADREDLLAEAVALVRRVELQLANEPELVTAGERADGRWSVYWGGDFALHFDLAGRLRRAFQAGTLYRTQGATLARLRRERTADTAALLRYDLSPEELAAFVQAALSRMAALDRALQTGHAKRLRSIPEDDDFTPRLSLHLQGVLERGLVLAPALK